MEAEVSCGVPGSVENMPELPVGFQGVSIGEDVLYFEWHPFGCLLAAEYGGPGALLQIERWAPTSRYHLVTTSQKEARRTTEQLPNGALPLARMGTRELINPVEVETTAPPAQAGPFEDFLGARMKPAARNAVTFSASDAARPFLTSNESLWDAFEPGLRERLADLEEGATTVRRVKAALLEGLPSGLASIEAVATKLSLSKRTLQRRIESEGCSYQQILQETREALAWHYLTTTALPSAEISFLLGFSEPNSFNRAFRIWTGLTPEGARHAGRVGTPPQRRSA